MFSYEVEATDIKRFIASTIDMLFECKLSFDETYGYTYAIDTSNTASVLCMFPAVKVGDELGDIAVNLVQFRAAINSIKTKTITISQAPGLILISGGKYSFKLPTLVDRYLKSPPATKFEYPIQFSLSSDDLADGIEAVMAVLDEKDHSTGIWFEFENGKFTLRDKERTIVDVNYPDDEIKILNDKTEGAPQSALMSTFLIKNIVSGMQKYEACIVMLRDSYPLTISSITDECNKVTYMLAPRIEGES